MKRWISLSVLAALIGAWAATPASAQKVEEVKKVETKQEAGEQAGEATQDAAEKKGGFRGGDGDPVFGEAKEGAEPPKKRPGTDVELLRKVANEEGRYRKRNAQLKRARAVAEEKGDEEALGRIAKLAEKNEAHHQKVVSGLREKHGDDHVDASLARINKHAKALKDGKGGARADAMREKAKQKKAEAAQEDKGKAKERWKKATDKPESKEAWKKAKEQKQGEGKEGGK